MVRAKRTRKPPDKTPLVFFTIVANNYMAYAHTLMSSVACYHPSSERYIVLCDELISDMTCVNDVAILPARRLGIRDFDSMAFYYDVMEFSTAIKPSSFIWLAEEFPGSHVIYLDPDILVTAPLTHIEQAMNDGASLVLTPHITSPLQDGSVPDDLTIMKSGIYNLGFAGFRMSEESVAFLQWWRDRCHRDAIVDIADNKFTDQRWVDMAPALVRRTHILHNHCYNLAYWNLAQRHVTRVNDITFVDGEPLRFVHFSGADARNRKQFSKHQNRFTTETLGDLRPLFDEYLDLLLQNGWEQSSTVPYAYNSFTRGRKIHPAMRGIYRLNVDDLPARPADGDGSVFDGAEPTLSALGPPSITRVMHHLRHRRNDLQRAFDIDSAEGRKTYLDWFIDGGAVQAGFDAASIAAAKVLRNRPITGPRLLKPWPSQAELVFEGGRSGLREWLMQPVPLNVITHEAGVPIPRCAALLWECRTDLSNHFQCQTSGELADYLVWCITSGVVEKSLSVDLLTPTVCAFLNATEEEASGAMPPVTRLMRLMARRYDGQFPNYMQDFPFTPQSRMALILWLLGAASTRYNWPESFCGALLAWAKQRAVIDQAAGPLLPNLVYSLWSLRTDVHNTITVGTTEGQVQLLSWVVNYGMRETMLPLRTLSDELLRFLGTPLGSHTEFLRYHQLSWISRAELKSAFNIAIPSGQAQLVSYLTTGEDPWDAAAWLDLLRPAPASAAVHKPVASRGKLLLTGALTAFGGRGEDSRMTAASLKAGEVEFSTLDRNTGVWSANVSEADAEDGTFDINIVHHNADTALPDYLFLQGKHVESAYHIGYWAWELSRLPGSLIHACSFYDEIWASTRFAYEAFRQASSWPVFLMPMAVTMPELDPVLTRADFGLPPDNYIFYFGFDFGSYASRKNPEAAVKAFRLAFPEDKAAATLLIKTMGGAQHPTEFQQLQTLSGGDPRIIVRDHKYSGRELATLVNHCNAFLSLHRSEGFGRGPAEAMLLGKPVIATGYSGNLDFMNAENSLLVDYKLVPVEDGQYIGWLGQEWADPDLQHAAQLMRIVTDRALANRIGQAARRTIREKFSPEVIGRLYRARILDIRAHLRGTATGARRSRLRKIG